LADIGLLNGGVLVDYWYFLCTTIDKINFIRYSGPDPTFNGISCAGISISLRYYQLLETPKLLLTLVGHVNGRGVLMLELETVWGVTVIFSKVGDREPRAGPKFWLVSDLEAYIQQNITSSP
jgi:hypothetical protein